MEKEAWGDRKEANWLNFMGISQGGVDNGHCSERLDAGLLLDGIEVGFQWVSGGETVDDVLRSLNEGAGVVREGCKVRGGGRKSRWWCFDGRFTLVQ